MDYDAPSTRDSKKTKDSSSHILGITRVSIIIMEIIDRVESMVDRVDESLSQFKVSCSAIHVSIINMKRP